MGHLYAIFTTLVWGSCFVLTKVMLTAYTPTQIIPLRMGLAYLALWALRPKTMKLPWKDELMFILIGITGGSFYFFLQNTASAHTSAANVSILVSMSPILTVLLAQLFSRKGEKLGKPGIETPLFTIPSFLSSNRGDDILFANFSWKQLWENIVWTFTTTWGSGDKSVTNTMVRFGPVYYITDLFFVIGLVSILRRLRGMEKEERYPYVALLAWLGMGLWVGILTKNVTVNRINIIFYPVLIIGGIGIARCIRKVHLLSVPIAAA